MSLSQVKLSPEQEKFIFDVRRAKTTCTNATDVGKVIGKSKQTIFNWCNKIGIKYDELTPLESILPSKNDPPEVDSEPLKPDTKVNLIHNKPTPSFHSDQPGHADTSKLPNLRFNDQLNSLIAIANKIPSWLAPLVLEEYRKQQGVKDSVPWNTSYQRMVHVRVLPILH